jgi:hypothetical protein
MAEVLTLVTVVELPEFSRTAAKIWSEEELVAFIDYIAAHPLAGVVVEGTGGIRKVRWSRAGAGKRGGVRVVYYYLDDDFPLFLLSIFAKNTKADLDAGEKRQAADFVRALKSSRKGSAK